LLTWTTALFITSERIAVELVIEMMPVPAVASPLPVPQEFRNRLGSSLFRCCDGDIAAAVGENVQPAVTPETVDDASSWP